MFPEADPSPASLDRLFQDKSKHWSEMCVRHQDSVWSKSLNTRPNSDPVLLELSATSHGLLQQTELQPSIHGFDCCDIT